VTPLLRPTAVLVAALACAACGPDTGKTTRTPASAADRDPSELLPKSCAAVIRIDLGAARVSEFRDTAESWLLQGFEAGDRQAVSALVAQSDALAVAWPKQGSRSSPLLVLRGKRSLRDGANRVVSRDRTPKLGIRSLASNDTTLMIGAEQDLTDKGWGAAPDGCGSALGLEAPGTGTWLAAAGTGEVVEAVIRAEGQALSPERATDVYLDRSAGASTPAGPSPLSRGKARVEVGKGLEVRVALETTGAEAAKSLESALRESARGLVSSGHESLLVRLAQGTTVGSKGTVVTLEAKVASER